MENNQPPMGQNITPGQPQVPQPVPTESAQSITQQPPPPTPAVVSPKSSHIIRTLLIMIIIAVVVILSILIFLWFVNNQSNNSSTLEIENKTTTRTPSPAKVTTEEELNAIDVGNLDDDLKEVDTELQGL